MAELTFAELLQAVQKLTPAEKTALLGYLQDEMPTKPITGEDILQELEARRAAGAFDHLESLYGKYARPGLEISEEELNAYLREIGTEWEQELDELSGDED